MTCAYPSKNTYTDSSFGSSRPSSAFSQWYFWISLYMAVQTLNTASFDLHLHFHHECHRLLSISSIKFWTAALKVHVLSSTIEQVYNAFFYTTIMHLLHQKSEEVLFSCFMTMLNAAFESILTLEDEGCESGSENFNIPNPLRWTSRIHHVSSDENISYDPSTPCTTATSQSHCKPYAASYHLVPLMMKKSSAVDIPI